jgi:hypothetical protein
MNRNWAIGISSILAAMTVCLSPPSAAGQSASAEPQAPLTASGSRLLAKYSGMLGALQEEPPRPARESRPASRDSYLSVTFDLLEKTVIGVPTKRVGRRV